MAKTNNFWRCVVLVALIIFPAGLRAATGADQSKPYGKINILESSEAEVNTLGNNEHDGAKTVFAYVDANRPCELLIAVFNRNGRRLAHDWKPKWVQIEEWQEQKLTLGSYADHDRRPMEVWALFIAPQTADGKKAGAVAGKIHALKAAVQDVFQSSFLNAGRREERLLRLLESFLEHNPRARRRKLDPLSVAGHIRGTPVPWRVGAAEVNFSVKKPGLVIIPSEPPERASTPSEK